MSGRRWTRGLGVVLLTAALAGTLAGCTAPRNALGNASSSCFRALAAAPAAVGHEGRFAGVRALSAQQLQLVLRHEAGDKTSLPKAIVANTSPVCVVEYRGTFHVASLQRPWPPETKPGASVAVVVDAKNDRPLATILLSRPIISLDRL
jgi:hypothetical protein